MKLGEIAPIDLAAGAFALVGACALALFGYVYWLGYKVVENMHPVGKRIRDGAKLSDAIFAHPKVLEKLQIPQYSIGIYSFFRT